jgi:AAA15 family ATPase/GTPase
MLYIKNLSLENVKCFGKRQTIDFTQGEDKVAQWTVILGDNGAGKTTVLRSLVAMLPLPTTKPTLSNWNLSINMWLSTTKFARDHEFGRFQIELEICDLPDFISEFTLVGGFQFLGERYLEEDRDAGAIYSQRRFVEENEPPICFAYGASRRVSKKSLSNTNIQDISYTLFDEEALLQNSEEYLLQLDYDIAKSRKGSAEINKVKELLIKVLPSGVKDIRIQKVGRLQRQVQVQTPYGWVPMNELSLGYKTTIAWLIDFATKMIYFHEKSTNPFAEPAILIIDEIDLHMHPAWQREIIQQLTDLFPKTQFIVTAHSPLIAQAALDANIVVLKREGDEVIVYNDPAIVRSWRIDQVLTSDLFGLTEVRPQHIELKMKRRRALLKKGDQISPKERGELDRLNEEIDAMPIGEGPVQMDAVDVLSDFAEKLAAFKASKAV